MNIIQKKLLEIRNNHFSKPDFKKSRKNSKENIGNYFQLATNWADDYYTVISSSRNRYKVAFLISMTLSILLTFSIFMLLPTHEYIPLLVHHYESGAISVEQGNSHLKPDSKAQIESEIVRYVVNRESYDPASFKEQFRLITIMSGEEVSHDYHAKQTGKHSFINELSNKTVRSVKIEDINFLDQELFNKNEPNKNKKTHKNLAEINFIVTDRNIQSGSENKKPYVALLSWEYRGIPNDPEVRWLDWNGFTVTSYQLNQRTI